MSHAIRRPKPVHRLVRVSGLLAPGPIEAEVRIILRLPNSSVAVAKEQLKAGIAKFVIPADVDQRGGPGLRSSQPFGAVVKDLGPERPFFA
jgi:hypothetical protein